MDKLLVTFPGGKSVKSTANTPHRLAGKLKFDDSSAGGANIDVETDAPPATVSNGQL